MIFLTIGFLFNAAAIGTCRLVAIDGFRDPDDGQLVRVTGLGLYTIEGMEAWGQLVPILLLTAMTNIATFLSTTNLPQALCTGRTAV